MPSGSIDRLSFPDPGFCATIMYTVFTCFAAFLDRQLPILDIALRLEAIGQPDQRSWPELIENTARCHF